MKKIIPFYLLLILSITSFSQQVSDTISISYLYNVTLIFDEPIIGEPRFGSSIAINYSKSDDQTIDLKADGNWMRQNKKSAISNTNVTIRTSTKLYNFILTYSKIPDRTIIPSSQFEPVYIYDKAVLAASSDIEESNNSQMFNTLYPLSREDQKLYDIGHNASKLKMLMTVTNIWVDKDYIYVKYIIENYGSVPYDIEYFRFVSTYKQWSFNQSTTPIKDYNPVAKFNISTNPITENQPYIDVVAFEKFTLDKKEFINIQVGEIGGSRLISSPISWKNILEADPLPSN